MSEQTPVPTRPSDPPNPDQPVEPDQHVEAPVAPDAPLSPDAPSSPAVGANPADNGEDIAPEEDIVPLEPPAPQEDFPDPEPFSSGPPPLPKPMLVLEGELPAREEPPQTEPVDHGTCAACGGAYDEDGWCTQCGERKPDPRHHFTDQPSAHVAGVCDRGVRHTDNEDAMAVWADPEDAGRAALVVCDGVTTATRSAEASLAAAEAALAALTGADEPAEERVLLATDAAAAAVRQVGEDFPDSAPSCTFVAAVVEEGVATLGSVGDSRAYWLPDAGEPVRLTTDDSMAEEQVRAGMSRVEAEVGPMAHTITRWLGPDAPDQAPEITTQDVRSSGWLLLCTDGLWNYASAPADLHAVVRAEQERVGDDPLALADGLVAWANAQGGADNITVALMRTLGADEVGGTGQDGAHG